MADDALAGVEHQHYKRLFHRVKSAGLWNVLPPILGYLIRFRQQFGHRFTFTDANDFELVRLIYWWHIKEKEPDTNECLRLSRLFDGF
jgi:hypothetical protein